VKQGIEQLLYPHNGLHMLPNLKILISGVVFALFLFAVTGAGIWLPESNTRVGEVPEVGRPMMQRMIADEPAQAQFHVLTVARRGAELDRLREREALDVAAEFAPTHPEPAPPESDLAKPAVMENLTSGGILAAVAATPALQPSGAMGTVSGTSSGSVQIRPMAANIDEMPDAALPPGDTGPVQVAALPPTSADAEPAEPLPGLLKVPFPLPRPSARTSDVQRRIFHRKPRVAQAPSDAFARNLFGQPPLPPR
jgi:hypothetical protein